MVRVKSEGRSKGCERCRARKVKVISRTPTVLLTHLIHSVIKPLQHVRSV